MTTTRTLAAIRFGYGLPLPETAPAEVDAMLAMLAGPDFAAKQWPIMGLPEMEPILTRMRQIKNEGRDDPALVAVRDALLVEIGQAAHDAQRATFTRSLAGPDGLRERLVSFWADHFSVIAKNPTETFMPFALVEDAIRPHLTGRFGDLLTAVTLHPAMLLYLDQSESIGPGSRLGKKKSRGLNENLARELIELHSLGVGAGYAQADVTQMAKLLTGLTYNPKLGMEFDPRRAEPGAETVLGKTYDGDGLAPIRAALADLALRPETAQHIARKLVVHFVSDQPDADLVAAVAAAYAGSGGDLLASYTALLTHPAAWVPQMEKARQPYDFIVASLRALGVTAADFQALPYKHLQGQLLNAMANMGQTFKRPGGPNGFPEEAEAWITPQGLARRITWAMQVPQRLVAALPDPTDLAQSCLAERASEALHWAVARAEDRKQGVGLVLASAEFNRR